MNRTLLASLAGLLLAVPSCVSTSVDEGTGSNTNWLRECRVSSDCESGFTCECGVCTTICDTNAGCSEGVCASPTSAALRSRCGEVTAASSRDAGICLRGCEDAADCEGGLCVDGSCVAVSSPSCPADARLELSSSVPSPRARVGSYFSNDYYVPVTYDVEPAGWVEPIELAEFRARVTDTAGMPIPDCAVTWLTAEDHGWAFPEATTTDTSGEIVAHWVAGRADQQTLRAAIRSGGGVIQATLEGSARAHDEAPHSTAPEATPTARAVPVYLGLPVSEGAEAFRLALRPVTFPAHTVYSVIRLSGFSLTLHNTSDADAGTADVPAAARLLSASAWNVSDTDPTEILLQASPFTCETFADDLGGTACEMEGAWTVDEALTYTVDVTYLTSGDAPPPSYLDQGLPSAPCAAPDSCTDLLLKVAREGTEPELVLAARFPARVPLDTWLAYVDPFVQSDDIPTCLDTARHEVSMSPMVLHSGEWQPLTEGEAFGVHTTWYNETCANHGVEPLQGEFLLWSGGNRASSIPLLPKQSRMVSLSVPSNP